MFNMNYRLVLIMLFGLSSVVAYGQEDIKTTVNGVVGKDTATFNHGQTEKTSAIRLLSSARQKVSFNDAYSIYLPSANEKFMPESITYRFNKNDLMAMPYLQTPQNSTASAAIVSGGWQFAATGINASMPAMLNVNSMRWSVTKEFGNLSLTFLFDANHYDANIMGASAMANMGFAPSAMQYGVGGSLQWTLNENWNFTAYGIYYNRNPYFYLAAFPYVNTSTYGGYFTYQSGNWRMDLGARRYYDAFEKHWVTEPIVTPSFKIGKGVIVELPLGGLINHAAQGLFHRHRRGVIIAPPMH